MKSERVLVLTVLSVASFAVIFNTFIIVPLLPEITDDFGVSVAVGGVLAMAFSLVAAFGGLTIGPLIDRSGRRFIILAGLIVFTVASILSAIAPTFWTLVLARGIAGIGVACLQSAVFAAIADSFPYDQRSKAIGWVYIGNTLATIAGLPLTGVLTDWLNWRVNFLWLGLLTLAALAFVWLLLPKDVEEEPEQSNKPEESYRARLSTVMRNTTVRWAFAASLVNVTHYAMISTFLGAFFKDVFDLPTSLIGIPPTLMSIGSIPGSYLGGWLGDRYSKNAVSTWGRLIDGVLIALLTILTDWQVAAFALVFLLAIPNSAQFMNSQALMTELLPELRGTVMAMFTASVQFGFVAGALVGGLVIESLGYTWLGVISGILGAISAVPFWLYVREPEFTPSVGRVAEQPLEPEAAD